MKLFIPITLLFILSIISSTYADSHTKAQSQGMEQRVRHAVQLFDRQDVAGFSADFAPEAIFEALDKKWTVGELPDYFELLNMSKIKSKITTPLSINQWTVVFARKVTGKFKDGCTLNISNVITLVKFNEKMQIVGWNDMWGDLEGHKKCAKTEL